MDETPLCKSCIKIKPKRLTKLPVELQKNSTEVLVCEYCDGPAIELAILALAKRKKWEDASE